MKKYFKCTLVTDIVINASLATEGNMKTLDYIPGSNFLGIAATAYSTWKEKNLAYTIFHSGKISFGDAHLAKNEYQSYAIPFSLLSNKLKPEISGQHAEVWLHHLLQGNNNWPKDKKGDPFQLKQYRSGFLNQNQEFIPKVEKSFALKSAQDRKTRKSKDSAMFGFESMKAGQKFIFSLEIKDNVLTKDQITELTKTLIGNKKIGKSKTAQYGQVEIVETNPPTIFENKDCKNGRLLIYAESNLCFFNKYGQPTFQPSPEDFGLAEKGNFDWEASQVRTYSYSPWNGKRKTTDPQRDCIQKGSVLVFNFSEGIQAENPSSNTVGGFNSEGLGRVIYNPDFLVGNEKGRWKFKLTKPSPKTNSQIKNTDLAASNYKSKLGRFLLKKHIQSEKELAIGKAVQEFITGKNQHKKSHTSILENIPTSQWGGIRAKATKAKDKDELVKNLFGEKGILTTGVAADRYWNKKGKLPLKTLEADLNKNALGNLYVIKLAAEMTKWKQQYDKSQNQKKLTHG